MSELLPWLQPTLTRLNHQISTETLPHAILISGPPSSGKQRLTEAITRRLLCSADDSPCGACHQCQLLEAETHPDYLLVTLEDSKQILIDQIRSLIEWAMQTSQQGGQKICVVNPAHKMNIQASNSLLKCLEEPPASTTIVLVTDEPKRLLPTIRSRCQQIVCPTPDKTEAVRWLAEHHQSDVDTELLLEIAGGVPLRAVELIDDEYLELRAKVAQSLPTVLTNRASPIQLAASFSGDDPIVVLDLMYQLVADTINVSMSASEWRNNDLAQALNELAEGVSLDARFEFLHRVSKAKEMLSGTSNANAQMLFEWILLAEPLNNIA